MKQKLKWPFVLALGIAGICLLTCLVAVLVTWFAPEIYQYSLERSSLEVGTLAPDFETLSLDGGDTVRLSQFRGKPVLLSFGATWCLDCRLEAHLVQELHQSQPELVILSVDSNESAETVREYVDDIGITYPLLLDSDGSISRLYQVWAIPTELFIDAEGVIQARLIKKVTPQLLADYLALIGVQP